MLRALDHDLTARDTRRLLSRLRDLNLATRLAVDEERRVALEGCSSLLSLYLKATGVTDVSALAGCSSLHMLELFGLGVTDVSALAGCPRPCA